MQPDGHLAKPASVADLGSHIRPSLSLYTFPHEDLNSLQTRTMEAFTEVTDRRIIEMTINTVQDLPCLLWRWYAFVIENEALCKSYGPSKRGQKFLKHPPSEGHVPP
jgi:hypothetical protein